MSPDDVVIEFAIANFLELDSMPTDDRQSHTEDDNLLADLPTFLRAEIQQYATETEMPLFVCCRTGDRPFPRS